MEVFLFIKRQQKSVGENVKCKELLKASKFDEVHIMHEC